LREAFEGLRGRFEQGRIGDALMRADEGSAGLRDGEGEEEVGPWELFVEMVISPLLSFMMRTLGTVSVATGVMDAVLAATALALREAVTVVSTLAMQDGTEGLLVCHGQRGKAFQVLWGVSLEDIAEGGHEASPCMRELMRW
jgi:hypothetical protein